MSHVLSCPYMKNNCTPLNLCEDCRDDAALDAAAFRDFMVETDRQIAPSDYIYVPVMDNEEIEYFQMVTRMIDDACYAEDIIDIDELDTAR